MRGRAARDGSTGHFRRTRRRSLHVLDGGAASGASGQKLFELTGGWTVPQILIDDKPIGGYVELRRLDRDGKLAA